MITDLKLKLIVNEISQAKIARAAGVHRSMVNRVVLGRSKASPRVAAAFKEVANIELDADQLTRSRGGSDG